MPILFLLVHWLDDWIPLHTVYEYSAYLLLLWASICQVFDSVTGTDQLCQPRIHALILIIMLQVDACERSCMLTPCCNHEVMGIAEAMDDRSALLGTTLVKEVAPFILYMIYVITYMNHIAC